MENAGIRNKDLTAILLASVYIGGYSLIKIVNALQIIFMPYQVERIGFFKKIYGLFYLSLNYWHMLALASCGILIVSILSSILKKNPVNSMILLQNRILLIILLVLSGIRIIRQISIIYEVAKGYENNFADIIRIGQIKTYQIIIWIFDSAFIFLILAGIILFSVVMLKKITSVKLKKVALYVSLVGNAGSFITRLILFTFSLPEQYNLILRKEMFGTTTAQILIGILGSAVLILVPVATIIIIHFGLKYVENIKNSSNHSLTQNVNAG